MTSLSQQVADLIAGIAKQGDLNFHPTRDGFSWGSGTSDVSLSLKDLLAEHARLTETLASRDEQMRDLQKRLDDSLYRERLNGKADKEEIARLTEDNAALDKSNLRLAQDANTLFDRNKDLAKQLLALQSEHTRLTEENETMKLACIELGSDAEYLLNADLAKHLAAAVKALMAAGGYIINAGIDLETGTRKATTIASLKDARNIVRAAIDAIPAEIRQRSGG